ncbi:MAG: mechanosensitive ion channel family protein [Chloroflexota bacterium]|nr:mechanosensitive ion channel family protein [Chloroflexota bacterium]
MQTTPADWLKDLRDLLEGSLSTAAQESAGFARDALSALVSLAWIAFVVVLAIWLGRKVRAWMVQRARAAWPANPYRATLIDQVLLVSMVVVAVLFAFRVIGVPANSLVTGIGIFLGALSIALQDVLKNLVAGMYLLVEQPFKHGDRLVLPDDQGVDGWVENVRMRVTEVRNPQRELLLVPNYLIFSKTVINRTELAPYSLQITMQMIAAEPEDVEGEIRAALLEVTGPGYTPPFVELTATGPLGASATIQIWFAFSSEVRQDVIAALHRRFPEAFLLVDRG